jgi:patatin-like phospholipase/acyl hydrolase
VSKHLILSCDGGGIRGVYTARLLRRLKEEIPGFLSRIDSLAGASTGGIVAAALADNRQPEEIEAIYIDKGERIFADSAWDNIRDMGILRGAQYDTEPLAEVLREEFGQKTLSDLKKPVLIPTLATDRRMKVDGSVVRMAAPKFFNSWPGGADANCFVVDVLRYCSAAPTFFPLVYGVIDGFPTYFVDGGVFDNNPSFSAVIQAFRHNVPWSDIVCLSVGTGANPHYIAPSDVGKVGKDLDGGILFWMQNARLLTAIMEPAQFKSHIYCEQALEAGQYHRLNGVLPKEWPLDSLAAIPEILAAADAVDIRPCVAWLKAWTK